MHTFILLDVLHINFYLCEKLHVATFVIHDFKCRLCVIALKITLSIYILIKNKRWQNKYWKKKKTHTNNTNKIQISLLGIWFGLGFRPPATCTSSTRPDLPICVRCSGLTSQEIIIHESPQSTAVQCSCMYILCSGNLGL